MTDEDSGADASRRRNNAIEKGMLLAEQARDTGGAGGRGSSGLHRRTGTKILLLGTGESGKSTVLKQMRLLHHNGFSQQERQQYAQVVWVDAIQLMKILVMQARSVIGDHPWPAANTARSTWRMTRCAPSCRTGMANPKRSGWAQSSRSACSRFGQVAAVKRRPKSESRTRWANCSGAARSPRSKDSM